jgi:hypothetical protein
VHGPPSATVIDVRIIGKIRRLGAFRVSVLNTVLVFVLIPAACVAVIVGLSRAGSTPERRTRRYRPGRPYDFAPIWFLASPERVGPALGGRTSEQRAQPPAIESGIIEDSSGQPVRPGSVGGASDRW